MSKILDNEFRKDLYKSLMEAGYEKSEAQHIIGVKYFTALKNKITSTIDIIKVTLENDTYDSLEENALVISELTADLAELAKMDKIVNVKKTHE